MKRFEGKIEHNEDTLRRLFKAAADTYQMRRQVMRMLVGAVMAVGGLFGGFPMIVQGILLMAGCWLIVSRDFPARCRADRTIEARGKKALPVIVTTFWDDHVDLNGEGRMRIQYKQFQNLREDKGYFFLFLDENSACMIDGKTLKPADAGKFKEFVADKTGLEWQETTAWFNMSLMDLFRMVSRRR